MASRDSPFEGNTEVSRTKRSVNWAYMSPMAITIALAMTRHVFRKDPVIRNRVFFGLIGVGLIHGTYLITKSASNDP